MAIINHSSDKLLISGANNMAFMMNMSSCQVTSVAGAIGSKAAPYIANFSTNEALQDTGLKSVLPQELSLTSSSVQSAQAQAVGGIDSSSIGRA
jgi:hypothetical protein